MVDWSVVLGLVGWLRVSRDLNTFISKFLVVFCLSADLKARLDRVLEEDYKQEEMRLEEDLPRMKELLLRIFKMKKLDVLVWMEGTKEDALNKDERFLGLLERANLVKGQTKYTHRNAYRQYELTLKGSELAEMLAKEA
jgi:hypothetical protein